MSDKPKPKDSAARSVSQWFHSAWNQLQGAWNQRQGDELNGALSDYPKGIKDSISHRDGGFTKQSNDQQQGFAAEAHHVGSFNIEAAAKGQNNHRATRDVGVHNDPVADIQVTTPAGSTRHQVKFYKDGEKTAAALSPQKYDGVGKIVPKDQLGAVKAAARKQALRNQDTRPNVSASNRDTADNATDTLASSDGKVFSKPLNRKGDGSAEQLVKAAKTTEGGPEYQDKARVRGEFNSMQCCNAAKAGMIGGAVSESAAILLELLRSDEPLTMEQCEAAALRVVVSSVKCAGNALLVTSIQHVGQAMVDAAAQQTGKTIVPAIIGKQLAKGNVAAVVAQIAVQMAQNLYKFSTGKIDNLQFASSTIESAVRAVGGGLAFGAGKAAGVYLGASIPAAISTHAIGGATLGSLGVMASGTAFAIGFAVAAGAYVNHYSAKGVELANADLESALARLNGGQIDLGAYAGKVGTLSELTFNWGDILPFSGAISVISEYGVRKDRLRAAQNSIRDQLDKLPEQERQLMQALADRYHAAIADIDDQYEQARASITGQASAQFDTMGQALDRHLEMRYLMFAPVRKNHSERCALMDIKLRREQQNQARAQAFADELKRLQGSIEGVSGQAGIDIERKLQTTIRDRMETLIPHKTGWDRACEFLELL